MRILVNISNWNPTRVIIIVVVAIFLITLIAIFVNKGKYAARLKSLYRRMEKTINKRYNGNLLNEEIINNFAKDQTNTYKSLKGKGKRKVRKYFEYYVKNIPELVILKSLVSADKNKNQIVILLLDDFDKVVYRWDKSRKVKGLVKACNKYQMLTSYIGFLFELPLNVFENAPYRFTNHDNDYVLTYKIVKNVKKIKRKQKVKKFSKKELKAQAKVEARKEKLEKKRKR